MSNGFLSRIIYALIGNEKEETSETSEEQKKIQNSSVSAGIKVPPKTDAESKDWVPDFSRENIQSQKIPPKQQIPEKENQTEKIEHQKNGGLRYLAGNAYSKLFGPIFEKVKSQKITPLNVALATMIIILLSFTPLFFYIKAFLIAILLILVAALSKLIQKLFPFVVGFDLCLFFTVVVGVAYHPIAGLAVGVVSSALGSLARGQYDMDKVIVPLFGYIVVSLLLPVLPFSDIFTIGIVSAMIYAVLMSVIFGFTMGFGPIHFFNMVTFFVTSIGFNYWLFSTYGASLLASIS